MRPLNFLFITFDNFPPYRVDVAVLFGQEMVRRNHKIDWIMQSQKRCRLPYQTTWDGGRVWVAPTDLSSSRIGRIKKHLLDIKNDLKVFSLACTNEYDFVQVKDKLISALLALVMCRIKGLRFVYWLSYPFPEASLQAARENIARYRWAYYVRGLVSKLLLYRVVMQHADHAFVQSEQMKKDVMAMGIPGHKLTPVPMGVSINDIPFENKRRIRRIPIGENEKKTVVYLGTLMRSRRLDFLIRVFHKVLSKVPNAVLYMVGAGGDVQDELVLKKEAMNLGIQNAVVFTGFLPMKEAWNYVNQANVCVSPFYPTPILNSTSPTKLVEYMAMGKPVVANDHPEQEMVISESGGGICVPYDENSFARAIITLLKHPSRALQMGLNGRRYVEKYRTYQVIADLVEKTYYDLCRS